MADRVLMITWGSPIPGREERGLEVFNEALGLCGRMQQDGRLESFDVMLFNPNSTLDGCVIMKGSAAQIAALDQDEEFTRNTIDAGLIVERLSHQVGYTNEGIAQQMGLYQEAVGKVPQVH